MRSWICLVSRLTGLAAGIAAGALQAQPVAFEVASIKTGVTPERQPMFCLVPCMPGERLTVEGARVDIRYMSLHKLIVTAYRIKPYQLSGPAAVLSERFDIQAKMPAGAGKEQVPEMLQALLAERFKLAVHRESREMPVYALVVGKNGSKLTEAEASDVPAPKVPEGRALFTSTGEAHMSDNGEVVATGGVFGPMRSGQGKSGGMVTEFFAVTMPGLVEVAAPHFERPVVDMTELKGSYHFVWIMSPGSGGGGGGGGRKGANGGPPATRPADSEPPSDLMQEINQGFLRALELAGLKMEARKAPVDVIVVDHVEKTPTEN